MYSVAVVLIPTVLVFFVTGVQTQSTVGDSCSELCRKCEDELEQCTEYQHALTGKINRTNQELSALRTANDQLQRKEKCEKTEQQEICTTQGSRTVCFKSSIRLGAKPQEFDDSTMLSNQGIEKVFVTAVTMHTRIWGAESEVIATIAVTYNTSVGPVILTHGDESCSQKRNVTNFKLEKGDKISNITARFGDMIDGLTFYTKKGTVYGPFGGTGGEETAISPPQPNGYLAYVKGSTTMTYDCRGIRYLDFVWGYEKNA